MKKEILMERPVSNHPDDWYLTFVLAQVPNKFMPDGYEYVTWLKNIAIGEEPSYNHGHYFDNYEAAYNDYINRK